MRYLATYALYVCTLTAVAAQEIDWNKPETKGQLYNSKQPNPDRTPRIREGINELLKDDSLGKIPYLVARTPLRSEAIPEMNKSIIWKRFYNYTTFAPDNDNYASGYSVDLISSLNCDPNPFKGDCAAGSFYALVNAPDLEFIRSKDSVKNEPLTDRPVPLAYGLTGYLSTASIEWLCNKGYYVIASLASPIENVILANASNPDLKDPRGPNYNKPFVGTIRQNLKVNMQLRRSGKWLWGTYFYDKGKSVPLQDRLYVVGTVGKDGAATLKEYAFDNAENSATQSGTFKGKLNDKTFSGTWSAPKGKLLPFQLAAK